MNNTIHNFRISGTNITWSVSGYECVFNCTGGINYITPMEIVLNKGYTTTTELGALTIIEVDK